MITLHALGNAEIETSVATITPSQEIVFAAALYLILERGQRVSRTRLTSLLWPRITQKVGAHRLRQTILQLKKLGIVVQADRNNLQLLKHDARSDVDSLFTTSPSLTANTPSVEFLPGYGDRCSEAYRDWVDVKREEIHSAIARILGRDLEAARHKGDWIGVERISSRCLVLDSFNETAVLAQAEATAMRGGKKRAIEMLDRYIAELGVSQADIKLPATLLRRRVVERIAERVVPLTAEPPLLGRETEMEMLTGGFEAARKGAGSATILIGEPGIGKSRLSAELGRFAELQGAQVQRARCRRTDVDRPLSLFADLVPHLRELRGALGCAPETFRSLKRLTEVELSSRNSFRSVDSEMLFHDLRMALLDLFDSVAHERCLVVLIDDVQWLDDSSAKILAHMVEWSRTKSLYFLINSRPGAHPFMNYLENTAVNRLALGPLSPLESATLLHHLVLRPDHSDPDPGFVDRCLSVAEGNPFFLQELAHHWVETGRRDEAPPSVSKVLEERLERLSREALRVLQASAVLGDHATLDRVESVLEYRSHQLLSAVEELSGAAMLGPRRDSIEAYGGQLQPLHDFLASAALGLLAPISLAFIHRRSADVLEKEIPGESLPATLLWACANHRHRAGDRLRALSLAVSCGQHLLEVGLPAEACRRFEDSLMYCTSNEDRLRVLPLLSTAQQVNGEWERSKETLRNCIQLSAQPGSIESHTDFEILLFEARHKSNLDFVTLLDDIIPCVESSSASPAHRVAAAVIALKVASDVGPSAKLDQIYGEIKPLLGMHDVNPLARLEAEIIYQTMRGEEEIPLEQLEEFAELARSLQGELRYSAALLSAASACRISGRDAASHTFQSRALEHATSHKLWTRIPAIILTEVRLHVVAENHAAARAGLIRANEWPIPVDDQATRAEIQFFEARVALEDGTLEELEAAVKPIEIVPPTYSVGRRTACLAAVLRLRLRQGQCADTIRPLVLDLEASHLVNRDIGVQDFEAYSLFLGLCAIGEEKRAKQLIHEYLHKYRRSKRPIASGLYEASLDTAKPMGDLVVHSPSTGSTLGPILAFIGIVTLF